MPLNPLLFNLRIIEKTSIVPIRVPDGFTTVYTPNGVGLIPNLARSSQSSTCNQNENCN